MEPQIPNKSLWPKINQFLQTRLRSDVDWTLRDEYPLAFSETNLGNIRIITDDKEEILSHTVLKTHLIKNSLSLFRVGLIGSVCTDPAHRGKGLGQANIESCLQAAKNQACDFVMLWTNLFEFYEKLGFNIGGSEISISFDKPFEYVDPHKYKIVEGAQISAQALLNTYNNHSLRTFRSQSDIEKYLKIPNAQIYSAWHPTTGQLAAYIVIGKGNDFANHIHEWGGQVSGIISLIHEAQKKSPKLTIITPPECQNLRRQLQDYGGKELLGVLGMINIVNPQSLCKKIKKAARAQGYDQLVLEYRDDVFYFGHADEIYQTDSNKDIVRLLFGPMTPDQIHDFQPKTMEMFKQLFPVPFWVWGWDSI